MPGFTAFRNRLLELGGISRGAIAEKPKLLDLVREATRRFHYRIRTEDARVDWTKRWILFHGKRHPQEMGEPEVVAFLTRLAAQRDVAASTQSQALSALVFLYKVVLGRPLVRIDGMAVRAKTPERLPTVFSRQEARAVLAQLDGTAWLAASRMYGAGLRLMECLRLRVTSAPIHRSAGLRSTARREIGRIEAIGPWSPSRVDPRSPPLRSGGVRRSEGSSCPVAASARRRSQPGRRDHHLGQALHPQAPSGPIARV
jgi:hypothetical protein